MKISIVTVAHNAGRTLADTLASVARQSHPSIEHWLIDGGSTDNTREVLQLHGQHLAGFVSEPDGGLYEAMNKGVALASGDVLGFINADDWYAHQDVLGWVAACFSDGADLVYGDLAFVTPEAPFLVKRFWRDQQHTVSDFSRLGWHPAHPTTFIRLGLFRELGGFDVRWRMGADYAFLARTMLTPGLKLRHIPRNLVNMRLGGVSTSGATAIWINNNECAAALRELGYPSPSRTIALKLARKIPQIWRARSRAAPVEGPWRPWDR